MDTDRARVAQARFSRIVPPAATEPLHRRGQRRPLRLHGRECPRPCTGQPVARIAAEEPSRR
ncbi:MAG: hypothetical protein ACK55I_14970 [bacterium]